MTSLVPAARARGRSQLPARWAFLIAALVLVGRSGPLAAVEVLPGAPLVSRWEVPAGDLALASGFTAIVHDRRGLLYLASEGGVVELDGIEWRTITLTERRPARSLAVDTEGRVWVGGDGAIGFLGPDAEERPQVPEKTVPEKGVPEKLVYHSLLEQLPTEHRELGLVEATLAARDGTVYFVGHHRLVWSRAGEIDSIALPQRFRASALVDDQLILITASGRLLRLESGHLIALPRPAQPTLAAPAGAAQPIGLHPLTTGGLVLIQDLGLTRLSGRPTPAFPSTPADAEQWEHSPFAEGIVPILAEWGEASSSAVLADGAIAIGTAGGALIVLESDGSIRQILEPSDGHEGEVVRALCEDPEGGLWVAIGRALVRVEIHLPVTRWGRHEGLQGAPTSVLPTASAVFVATTRGVFRLRSEATGRPTEPPGHASSARFEPVVVDQLGPCWDLAAFGSELIAACRSGLWLLPQAGPQRLLEGEAFALVGDPSRPGTLWAGHSAGLARLTRSAEGRLALEVIAELTRPVRSLVVEASGTVLISSAEGTSRFDPDARRSPEAVPELPIDPTSRLFSTPSHGVLATGATGLFRFDSGRQQFVHQRDVRGRESPWVGPVAEAQDGTLWLVAREGLYAVGSKDRGDATPVLRLPAGSRLDPAGVTTLVPVGRTVWIGSHDGLMRLWTTTPLRPRVAPRVLIRRVSTSNGAQILSEGAFADPRGRVADEQRARAQLGPGRTSLRFEVASPRWDSRRELRYRFRLVGAVDGGWSGWSPVAAKETAGLGPGLYRLEVQAKDGAGLESAVVSWQFEVVPHWYETWWARAAVLLVAVLAIGWLVRAAARYSRERALSEAREERRRRELHDARVLHQSMVPATPPTIPGLDFATDHRTASEVGGDYWDVFPQGDGRIFLAIGDATGHGLAAGLMVAATRTALLTVEASDLPSVLRRLDRVLRQVAGNRRHHMALALVELLETLRGWRLELAGAGIPPAFVLRTSGAVEELSCPGLPLGAGLARSHHTVAVELRSGDVALFFTDGLFERLAPSGEQLGWDGLSELVRDLAGRLRRAQGRLSARELLDLLLVEWDAACAPPSPTPHEGDDDVTVVMVRCSAESEGGPTA